MLWPVRVDASADVQQASVVKVRRVGDDLVVQLAQAVRLHEQVNRALLNVRRFRAAYLEDSADVDRVGVGEAEEGRRGLLGRLEMRKASLHGGMLKVTVSGRGVR